MNISVYFSETDIMTWLLSTSSWKEMWDQACWWLECIKIIHIYVPNDKRRVIYASLKDSGVLKLKLLWWGGDLQVGAFHCSEEHETCQVQYIRHSDESRLYESGLWVMASDRWAL